MKRAWYLGVSSDEVADRCVLVGDPGRVKLFSSAMHEARVVNEQRGLLTVTGDFEGVPVTVAAFGMGAPIAAVVLEELAALGASIFLRAGTAMSLTPDVPPGSFVVGLAGVRDEGTSLTYAPKSYPAVADFALTSAIVRQLEALGVRHSVGVIGSDDGFYSRLFALSDDRRQQVSERLAELRRLHVLATDMETSAVLTVGAVLSVQASSLCLVSVDAASRTRLGPAALEAGERTLVEAALRSIVSAGAAALRETASRV